MLDLKDLQFLSALARHRHFAKAASACGVSQPAFSMRIRAMEDRLNTAIVNRGNRFQGLTPEGEAILRHARPILDQMRALEQDLLAAKGAVSGTLVLGVIPTAAAYAAQLSVRLRRDYPGIMPRIETFSSLEIQQGIEEGAIDAGLTYSDNIVSDIFSATHVYDETYMFLSAQGTFDAQRQEITWAEAAKQPLCLLEPKMRNRLILDRIFEKVGVRPQIVAEADAMSICVALAREGQASTVVPAILMDSLGPLEGTALLRLTEPVASKSISLISAARAHGLPTVEALRRVTLDS